MSTPSTTPEVKCPKCGSTQLHADKKGFSGKQAVAGAVVTGGIGLLAGTIGSNKIKITCLNCGHVFSAGDSAKHEKELKQNQKELAKKTFYRDYQAGNKVDAFLQLKQADPAHAKFTDPDQAYRSLKRFDTAVNIISLVFVVGLIIFLIYLFN